jgi:hypothetical protein
MADLLFSGMEVGREGLGSAGTGKEARIAIALARTSAALEAEREILSVHSPNNSLYTVFHRCQALAESTTQISYYYNWRDHRQRLTCRRD